MVKDWDELEVEYIFAKNMKLTPNMKKLSNNYITDETKTVKWNREQVEKNHIEYEKEVVKLLKQREAIVANVLEDIYKRIQYETGYTITRNEAKFIWDKAYTWTEHNRSKKSFSTYLIKIKEYCDILYELNRNKHKIQTEEHNTNQSKETNTEMEIEL